MARHYGKKNLFPIFPSGLEGNHSALLHGKAGTQRLGIVLGNMHLAQLKTSGEASASAQRLPAIKGWQVRDKRLTYISL